MATAKYTAQHVANFFLEKGDEDARSISPLKLLKLVYIAYGWYLALTGEKLFDDDIEAWQHGPVIPSLYHEFKHFRSDAITERASLFDLDSFDDETPEIPASDKTTINILERVWSVYKNYSGWILRNKTHASASPWDQVYQEGQRGIVISDDLIKAHYQDRISKYLDASK